ncbi:RICIN domain-containing protein [Kitasatospora sp. NPDC091335]|uniref:RICIN domain-containing protein n=1 Tax=Kitasatospora sp. NPDC091335 TaxID=3364085 RepID=UPI00381CB77E
MSPARRIATAAVTAVLLAGTPGLAMAVAPQTTLPSLQTEEWRRFSIWPPPNLPARNLDVDSSGRVVVSTPDPASERQQWSLSADGGLPVIKNRATGTCLTAPDDTLDPVTVQTCDKNNPNQRWDVHDVTSSQVEISPPAHGSLALTGGAQAGSNQVVLRPYTAAEIQQWSIRSVK